jgi:hypothetical protein
MKHEPGGWPAGARHCLRLGAMNDKRLVEAAKDSFDVVVLQANLAISAPQALASWHALDKPFWIDPIAYAFTASPAYLMSEQKVERGAEKTETRYKRTFVKLAAEYGAPFTTVLDQRRPLVPADFENVDLGELVTRMLEWQRQIFRPPAEDAKYGLEPELEPALLTVPFFPLQAPRPGERPGWLDVNMKLIEAALAAVPGRERLALGVLVEADLFDDWWLFEPLLNVYLDLDIDHIWFWISENEEVDMSLPRAKQLREVVRSAQERGRHLHQAFGGSFSTLLLTEGLASVAHGVNYWEAKGWEPLAGGGLPTARYFYPPLRQRLPVVEVASAFEPLVDTTDDFHRLVCDCRTCREIVQDDVTDFGRFGEVQVRYRRTRWGTQSQFDAPTATALAFTKMHYLLAKGIEVEHTLAETFDVATELDRAIADHESQFISTRHLTTWRRAFTEAPQERAA